MSTPLKNEPITIKTLVKAPIETVWERWVEPSHITQWAFASDDWEAPAAVNDLRVGHAFSTTMAAKDKSFSFEFSGKYTDIQPHQRIEYDLDDGRHVTTVFATTPEGVEITQTFDPEAVNTREKQRDGWQAILENFKKHAERSL